MVVIIKLEEVFVSLFLILFIIPRQHKTLKSDVGEISQKRLTTLQGGTDLQREHTLRTRHTHLISFFT